MATCIVKGCGREVETHRYIRAEPLARIERDGGGERLAPIREPGVSIFACLSHPLGEIEEAIAEHRPPSEEVPVRLLWSPAPGVKVNKGMGVVERRSADGHHGVMTIIVRDKGALHMALPELVPEGTTWFIPHGGPTPKEAASILTNLFGDDDDVSAAIREKLAKLGEG